MSQAQGYDDDDAMDEFMDKFTKHKYKGAFDESNWEEEFEKVPMFMKTAPEEIDPEKHPELACLQSIIHDDERGPEGTGLPASAPTVAHVDRLSRGAGQ